MPGFLQASDNSWILLVGEKEKKEKVKEKEKRLRVKSCTVWHTYSPTTLEGEIEGSPRIQT